MYTNKQLWHITQRRFMIADAIDSIATEAEVDEFLAAMPPHLPKETQSERLIRGQKFNVNLNFRYITEIQRLAADTRETEDALPNIPLKTMNQQFRLTVTKLPNNKLRLTLETLGLALSRYANCRIGIAATSTDQVIAEIQLNADGEGVEETLENTPAHRQVLLRPYIGLLEERDNA